jgi:hypothetical protein
MNPDKDQKWSPFKKFGVLFFTFFFALEIVPSFLRFFLGNAYGDLFYYPSFFVQNYILQLHEIPRWTHEVSAGGDTLDDWGLHLAYVIIALLAAVFWTLLDRKRKNYASLYKWGKIAIRYYLGPVMLLYGLNKLFLNQMVYPELSYFYTPLGDFYPMDLVWTFVGYSPAYQFIGGLLEFVAGLLILFRRTLVLGLLIFLGVMSNVLMFNYLYGVGVKSYSTVLVLMGLFLLAEHIPKLIDFLLRGKPAKIEVAELHFTKPWKKRARLLLKYGYIAFVLIVLADRNYRVYARVNARDPIPIEGAYDVHTFVVNGEANTDYFNEERWNQVVVNPSRDGSSSTGHVSLGTTKRELATFEIDSLDVVTVTFANDTSMVFSGTHRVSGDAFIWTGTMGTDSTRMILKKNTRVLSLHERPFTLINEPNGAESLRKRR